jgi:O-acetyl-ADP-ribose deacetylase (regulator of RNase III)
MGPDFVTSADYIRLSTASALAAAARAGAKSVAFPALGTGVGGFPLDRAAELMVREVLSAPSGASVERVLFVVRRDASRRAFEDAIASRRGSPDLPATGR